MRLRWRIALFSMIGVVVLVVLLGATYINNVGYNNLKLMYKLNTTDVSIIQMEDKGQFLGLNENSNELVKDRMEREGWQFRQQEGSGFFFKKDNKETIVTTKIWNGNYVIYYVDDNTVNIADK
ncbi:type II toxin-antitoxin system HicA family toxin [Paenibacillus sp. YPG26]|uniref:type II toxin-antitoxin system HicA family toxin n=1 Tax=Paenibacillus sp. YPG26 TaxID=2878915 RepID=UPI00203D6D27|nr:type II toxin-antitoxin system HicA family toxin [Paenibacillus sp. YPG26]USB33606.1 type II toxin-antitoxin system HicA family toxin [Paenibacillus sp. YPG26]